MKKTPLQRKNVVEKHPEKSGRQKKPFDQQKKTFCNSKATPDFFLESEKKAWKQK